MQKIITRKVFFYSNGHRLFGLYESSGGNNGVMVLMLHGLTNSHNTCPMINEAAKAFQNEGFSTFRFDYYGSGKSDGQFIDKTLKEMAKNTLDAYLYVKNNLPFKEICVWGRSFGAILAPVVSWRENVIASMLISGTAQTNISLKRCFPGGGLSLPFSATGKIKGKPILRQKFYQETLWLDNLQKKYLHKSKNILIIQGTSDKTVYDMGWAKELHDLAQNPKKLIYLKGADHTYKGYEKKVIKAGIKWLRHYCL